MENSENDSEAYRNSFIGSSSNSRRFSVQLSASNIIQAPLSMLLEFSGIFRTRSSPQDTENLVDTVGSTSTGGNTSGSTDEVSIRIISSGEQEGLSETSLTSLNGNLDETQSDSAIRSDIRQVASTLMTSASSAPNDSGNEIVDGEPENGVGGSNRDSSYQRYDIQHATRWIQQILPFSLLLLVVFIRQHLQGFFVIIWISVVMFKSNDILKKQTALKSDRNCFLLLGVTVFFILHAFGIYWWYRNDDLLLPLALLPPTKIPPFWHAIFVIMVNDMLVRQTAMIFKCMLLVYYKNKQGHKLCKQGQMLTLVEYFLLLYRALLPAPVWYRFFLNKEYGSLFSSLTTGLYLTFKLTSIVGKGRTFFAALRALSRKEVHYGSYATKEQVHAAGDVCPICQETMHAPILLHCKHIFCEDCVSEWFERERTCPLCRALVKPANLKSFSDGSTSLFFQLF